MFLVDNAQMHCCHSSKNYLRFALISLIALISGLCHAGFYEITYSGGKVVQVDPDNNRTETPYGPQPGGGWGGGGVTGKKVGRLWVTGPGTVSCEGQIVVTLTWNNGGDPSDLPPKSVIVRQYSRASWGGNSGSASNGLGHPVTGTAFNGVSEGVKHTIYNTDVPIIFAIEPSASGTFSEPVFPVIAGGADVVVEIAVTPVRVRLSGTTAFSNSGHNGDHILIGQGITTYLDAGGYTFANHAWQVGTKAAKYFHHVEWGQQTPWPNDPNRSSIAYRRVIDPPSGWFSNASLSYFYESPGTEEVKCTATAMVDGVPIGTVDVSRLLLVDPPNYLLSGDPDRITSFYDPLSGVNATKVLAGGMKFLGSAYTPLAYQENGFGSWNFTQLGRIERYLFDFAGSPPWRWTTNEEFWLDNVFPYKGSWEASGRAWDTSDRPSNGLLAATARFDIADTFRMFNVYLPPSVGKPVEWVPVAYIEWAWTAKGQNIGGSWTLPPVGGTFEGDLTDFPNRIFQWNNVLYNGQ